MSKLRLAIVRQKYRPDGGAERFISRALEALGSEQLDLNIITRSWSLFAGCAAVDRLNAETGISVADWHQ